MLLNLFKYVVFYYTFINCCTLLNALFIYLSFLYGCNVPELSYLIELKLNSDVLTKCLIFYNIIFFYIYILCYNVFN